MVDGGYLNNRPLDVLLREIYNRPTTREVSRKIFLVEPSPHRPSAQDASSKPDALGNLMFHGSVAPRDSLAEALKMLQDHNRAVRQVTDVLRLARHEAVGAALDPAGPAASHPRLVMWRKVRMLELRGLLMSCWQRKLESEPVAAGGSGSSDQKARRDRITKLASLYDDVGAVMEVSWFRERAQQALDDLDPCYTQRKAMRAADEAYELLTCLQNDTRAAASRDLGDLYVLRHLASKAQEVVEVVLSAMDLSSLLQAADLPAGSPVRRKAVVALLRQVRKTVRRALRELPPGSGQSRWDASGIMTAAAAAVPTMGIPAFVSREVIRRMRAICQDAPPSDTRKDLVSPLPAAVGAAPVDDAAAAAAAQKALDQRFLTYLDALDVWLLPLEHVARLECRQEVEFYHISPSSVHQGLSNIEDHPAETKVAGDVLFNMGAFLKRAWRSNDILWGSLDGSCRLADALLDADRLQAVLQALAKGSKGAAGAVHRSWMPSRFTSSERTYQGWCRPATRLARFVSSGLWRGPA